MKMFKKFVVIVIVAIVAAQLFRIVQTSMDPESYSDKEIEKNIKDAEWDSKTTVTKKTPRTVTKKTLRTVTKKRSPLTRTEAIKKSASKILLDKLTKGALALPNMEKPKLLEVVVVSLGDEINYKGTFRYSWRGEFTGELKYRGEFTVVADDKNLILNVTSDGLDLDGMR